MLYVDAENPPDAAASRIAAWLERQGEEVMPQLVYHQSPRMELGDAPDPESWPSKAHESALAVLREQLGDADAKFDAIILDNLQSLQNVEDGNNPSQAKRSIKAAQQMGGQAAAPVVLAVHPSQGGGRFNRARLEQGKKPEPASAISGAMTTANACEAILCLARDPADDGHVLMGTAKMRAARLDPNVYQSKQIPVDVPLPSWIDDDGEEHPPRVQSGVPMLGDEWPVRGKTSSAASELVEWMAAAGLEGRPNAGRLKEVAALEGCPVTEGTLRNYAKGESDPAREAAELGFRSALGERPAGRKGRAPLLLWIATAEEIDAESAECGRCGAELAEDDADRYLPDGTPLCVRCSALPEAEPDATAG